MKKNLLNFDFSEQQLEKELQRAIHRTHHWSIFKNIVTILFVASVLSVVITTFIFPLHRVTEHDPVSDLKAGQVLITYKTQNLRVGELALVDYNDQLLARCITAVPGDMIQQDDKGHLLVNGVNFPEETLRIMNVPSTDVTYPFQVPGNCYYVLDEDRTMICLTADDIIGKILFRIWPLNEAGFVG